MRHYIAIGLLLLATMAMAESPYGGGAGGMSKAQNDSLMKIKAVLGDSAGFNEEYGLYGLAIETDHEVDTLLQLQNGITYMYPDTAAGASVAAAAGGWVNWNGSYTQIVPANAITEDFAITGANVGSMSANQTISVALYYGNSNTFFACFRVASKNFETANFPFYPFTSGHIPKNSKITARAVGSGAVTIVFSLSYRKMTKDL